jgi:hypothetical protein
MDTTSQQFKETGSQYVERSSSSLFGELVGIDALGATLMVHVARTLEQARLDLKRF